MPIEQIDLSAGEATAGEELGGAAPTIVNAFVDGTGAVIRRPGATEWYDDGVGSSVIGISEFQQYLIWVTADRKIHARTKQGLYTALSSEVETTKLDGIGRPYFMPGRGILVIAGGGAPQKWEGTGLSSRLLGSPPDSTHVCGVAQRLTLCPPGNSGHIYYSGTLEAYEDWDLTGTGGAGYIQASAKPDKILAMHDNTNELYVWGPETVQVFDPNPTTTPTVAGETPEIEWFVPARTSNIGLAGPDAIIKADDAFMLIDRLRRVILTDARSVEVKSVAISKTLAEIEDVSTCWGFRMRYAQHDAFVFMFPSINRGLIWEGTTGRWIEWRDWDGGSVPVRVNAAHYWTETGKLMVGSTSGKIGYMSDESTGDFGAPIKVEIISGVTTHKSLRRKWSKSASFVFKKEGEASGFVRVSVRDDTGPWRIIKDVVLTGRKPTVTVRSLGIYTHRQWKIEYTGAQKFALVSAHEDFEFLEV